MLTQEQIHELYQQISKDFGLSFPTQSIVSDLPKQPWNPLFIEYERQAIQTRGQTPLLLAVSKQILNADHFYSETTQSNLAIFKMLVTHLPAELLQLKMNDAMGELFGKTATALSLAIDIIVRMSELNLDDQIKRDWLNDVIKPLLTKDIDVDLGNHHQRKNNLIFCLNHAKDESDPVMELMHLILEKTKHINDQDAMNQQTGIFVILRRGWPLRYFELFAQKGACFNLRALQQLFSTYTETPFLTHCIKIKNYAALQFALEQGADPNLPAHRIGFTPSHDREPLLTPFQYAVNMSDEEAIKIFIAWSQKTNIALDTKLPAALLNSKDEDDIVRVGQNLKSLEFECRNRLFKHERNLAQELLDQYGVRCYVDDSRDKENVIAAVKWLYEVAPHSAFGIIWNPILSGLKKKFDDNPNFAIYVSNIPKQAVRGSCLGLYKDNIYLISGMSKELLIEVLAHEAGHLFDHEQTTLAPGSGRFRLSNTEFASRFFRDVARDPSESALVEHIRKEYQSSSDPIHEFFAYFFLSEVVMRVLNKPNMTEEALILVMQHKLPETFAWYQEMFPQASACSCHH